MKTLTHSLYHGTLQTIREKWKLLLAGLAVALAVNVVISTVGTNIFMKWGFDNIQSTYGIDVQRLGELAQKSGTGDKQAETEMYSLMAEYVEKYQGKEDADKVRALSVKAVQGDKQAEREVSLLIADYLEKATQGKDAEQRFKDKLKGGMTQTASNVIVPILGLGFIALLFQYLATIYYFIVGTSSETKTKTILRQTARTFFPLIGLYVWIFLVSGVWVVFLSPLVGYLALFLAAVALFGRMPRYMLAPVFLIKNKMGIKAAAQASFEQTEKTWIGILFGIILICAGTWALGYISKLLFKAVASLMPTIVFYASSVADELILLLSTLVMVQLLVHFYGVAKSSQASKSVSGKVTA